MRVAESAKLAMEAMEEEPTSGRDTSAGGAVCECISAAEWDAYVVANTLDGEDETTARARLYREKTFGVECDVDCLNRDCQILCTDDTCMLYLSSGVRCQNRSLASMRCAKVVVARTESCGWGLFAVEAIEAGALVIQVLGELISGEEAQERLEAARGKGDTRCYMIEARGASTKGLRIDASLMGNESRFANHSCDPNCRLDKWHSESGDRYGIFAKLSIEPGEEITYDYQWSSFSDEPCMCSICISVKDRVSPQRRPTHSRAATVRLKRRAS